MVFIGPGGNFENFNEFMHEFPRLGGKPTPTDPVAKSPRRIQEERNAMPIIWFRDPDRTFEDTKLGRDIGPAIDFFKEKLKNFRERNRKPEEIKIEIIPPTYITPRKDIPIPRQPTTPTQPKINRERVKVFMSSIEEQKSKVDIKREDRIRKSNLFFQLQGIDRNFNLNHIESFKIMNLNKFINLGPLLIEEINKNKI